MKIDSHVHLITADMIKKAAKRIDRMLAGDSKRAQNVGGKFFQRDFVNFLSSKSVLELAQLWESELDKNDIDHACFLPIGSGGHSQLEEFVDYNPSRFSAYLFFDDPLKKKAVMTLRRLAKTGKFVGIKLYPCLHEYSTANKKLYPLYEAAGALNIPVLIHFGITHAPVSDYRYTNPLDIQAPSKLFPETNFIIAHFGAGFFREVLLLGFHSRNIYVDTSGTNNWRLYTPDKISLKQVFKRTIEVYGAERILFGTDSALNDKTGYRTEVLREQTAILSQLNISAKNRKLILGANTRDLFRLDDRIKW